MVSIWLYRPADYAVVFYEWHCILIYWLYCIDLFSCIAASLFNKLTYLLYCVTIVGLVYNCRKSIFVRKWVFLYHLNQNSVLYLTVWLFFMTTAYFVNYSIKTKYRMFKFVLFVSLQLSYVTCDSCKHVDELISRQVVSLQVSYLGISDIQSMQCIESCQVVRLQVL